MTHALGFDIGGTNIKALAVTPDGRVLAEVARPTGDRGTRGWIANVKRARADIRSAVGSEPSCIGVAAPGLAAPDGLSIHHMPGRLPGLEGLDWARTFRVPHPVRVLNDAHAALLGEVWLGAARGRRDVILLTLGTGVGGAAWVDGRLLRGHLGRAGHLGHISLDPNGPPDIARTPGSLEDAIGECTLAARCGGRFSSTRDLVAAAARRDPAARAVWLASVRALGAGIASLVNVLDPEAVLLGGGIAKAGPALFRPLRRYLDQYEWRPDDRRIRLLPARLGDRAGAFGAAWNAMRAAPGS